MKAFFKNSFPYFRRYFPVQILATLFGLMRMVILLVTPQVVALLVDRVINPLLGAESVNTSSIFSFLIAGVPGDDYVRIFWILAAALVVFAALFFVCFYLKWNLAHYYGLKSEKQMRMDALNKLSGASAPLLAKYSAGDLVLITTSDPFNIRELYTGTLQFMLDNVFYIVVCSVFLSRFHYSLLFMPLIGGVLYSLVIVFCQKYFKKLYEKVWKDTSELSTIVQESVYGVRTVTAFAKEGERRKIFARGNGQLFKTNLRGVKLYAMRNLLTQVAQVVVLLGEAILGIWLGLHGKITAGEFTAMLGYIGTLMWQFAGLLFNINNMQRNLVSAKRFFGFLQDRDTDAEKYGTEALSAAPCISFRGVSVKNGDNYALEGVDLDIPYGKKLGVMGKTGSGKTLICKLMQGFAEADEGEIFIDGKPIHHYDRDEICRRYSYAMQNVFLFSNTIAANIALYDPFADEEKIERAGALAEVDEFARRFPEGYMTTIGEKGFGLSGGQKQRISIARALFKNANILVFDDVTSALDLDTERKVFQNLERECGDRTQILVTHRATVLKNCDEIIFLDGGKITERGTFEELMALRGNFAEIYNRQVNEVAYEE